MARTIAEIKQEMTDYFVSIDTIQALYELDPKKKFEEQFSKVSIESIFFYVVATCAWTLEKLFDRHRQEVTDLINDLKPHSIRWYAGKAKAFQFGKSLVAATDQYDNSDLTDEQIARQQIVKYAAVVEKAAIVYVKVATGDGGSRAPLAAEELAALEAYFKEVKDAGVKLKVVNDPADLFGIDIDIYYDPQVFDNRLYRLDGKGQSVHDTIAAFVENLPFNGEYRNSALINRLTELEGVVLIDLKRSTANGQPIPARIVPESGYFRVDKNTLGINAIAYETVSD